MKILDPEGVNPNLNPTALIPPRLSRILNTYQSKDYPIDESDYGINMVAIRNSVNSYSGQPVPNTFNDLLCIFFKINGSWQYYAYTCTTIPGQTYFTNPMDTQFGTAIIVPGYYPNAYILGLHRGVTALAETGALDLYRDNSRSNILHLDPQTIQTGSYGINVHYSSGGTQVDNWSAGCIVLDFSPDSATYQEFISLFVKAMQNGHPNNFALTLLLQDDLAWTTGARIAAWTIGLGLAGLGLWTGYEYLVKPYLKKRKQA